MKTRKQYNKATVNAWIDGCLTSDKPGISYAMRRNTERGLLLETLVDNLSSDQLKILAGIIAGAYNKGVHDGKGKGV
jgi:hypothetical protein